MILNTFVVISILGITFFAFYYITKEKISFKKKILFFFIRLLIALLLILAFLEPFFTIRRYINPSNTLGILVDASQSMTLFKSDSLLKEIKKNIESMQELLKGKNREIKWFLFGDSLRNFTKIENVNFNDRKSNFPDYDMSRKLKNLDEFIILSDGNWTNPKIDFSQIQDKILWYFKLPNITPTPFVSIESPETLVSYLDSNVNYNITCKGFVANQTKLDIILEKDEKHIYTDSIQVFSGYFNFPYSLKIKSSKKGYNLYKVTIVNRSNNIKSSNFFLHKVSPSVIKYSIYFNKPSLDIRYLKLALSRDRRFTEVDTNIAADIIFLFSPDIQINSSKLNKTLFVFVGCAPEETVNIKLGKEQKLFLPDPTLKNPFFSVYNKNLPPISEIIKSTSVTKIKSLLSLASPGDTFPLVFTGEYKRKIVMVCAFSGLWKWDFLPLSYGYGESDIFTMSNSFIDAAASLFYSMQNDTFLVFPAGKTLENKYIKFLYTLPYDNSSFQNGNIECRIYKKNNLEIVYDTSLKIENTGSLSGTFSVPSPDKDIYITKNFFYNNEKTYKSECTFELLENNEELSVMGQNETILKEIGKAIDINDTTNIKLLLKRDKKEILPVAVPYKFTIKKSWWLLISILSLFIIEWFLRKVWNIER